MLAAMADSKLQMKRVASGMTREYVAKALNTSEDMIFKLEKRKRQITEMWLKKFSSLYNCAPSDLLDGADGKKSPILGYVGGGGHVFPIDDLPLTVTDGLSEHIQPDDPVEWVDTPYGLSNVAALRVQGDSMYPMLHNGWLVFYNARVAADFDNHLGEPVIVWLKNGSVMVKTLRRGTQYGRYNLESFNAPLIEDAELRYVARIESITPRRK